MADNGKISHLRGDTSLRWCVASSSLCFNCGRRAYYPPSIFSILTIKSWSNIGSFTKGAGLMPAPYFFHKTRVQKSVEEICTLFFSRAQPRIAQERRLSFRSVVSPVKRLNALRAVYGLLLRLVKSGAFAVSVWIAVSQPIAADLHCTATVLAEAFPSGFIAGDPFILHWLDYFEISKGLACKVVLKLELGATTGSCFTFSKTV